MADEAQTLTEFIRTAIRERGPVTFRWFMEQALYHPAHGFYSSGTVQDWATRRLLHERQRGFAFRPVDGATVRRNLGTARSAG